MTREMLEKVVRIIRDNYATGFFIKEKATADLWFNQLARFSDEDISKGITTWVMESSSVPTLHDVVAAAQKEADIRISRERIKADTEGNVKLISCKYCRDNGYTLKKMPNGSEILNPCNRDKGKEAFPWYFMPREVLQEKLLEEQKRGQKVCMNLVNPPKIDPEWKKQYYSGTL